MPKTKNQAKNKSRFEIRGGVLNEYEFSLNEGAITEEERNRFAQAEEERQLREGEEEGAGLPMSPQEREAARIREVIETAHEKAQRNIEKRERHAAGESSAGGGGRASKAGAGKKAAGKGGRAGAAKKGGAGKGAQKGGAGKGAAKKGAKKSAKKGGAGGGASGAGSRKGASGKGAAGKSGGKSGAKKGSKKGGRSSRK